MKYHPRRSAFSLTEVMIASVVFFVILMVFQMVFAVSTRTEGRDGRRTQAGIYAAEVLEQVTAVHARLGDLPTGTWPIQPEGPGSFTLVPIPGGELQVTKDSGHFERVLEIRQLRSGTEDALVRPDRLYQIIVRVTYPGPVGENREVVLTTARARQVLHKPYLEKPPWL
jgi:hypothetical protein